VKRPRLLLNGPKTIPGTETGIFSASCVLVLLATTCGFSINGPADSTVAEEPIRTADTSIETRVSRSDSLRAAIEELKNRAKVLRMRVEAIQDSVDQLENIGSTRPGPLESDKKTASQKTDSSAPKDTVQILSKESTSAFLKSIRGKKRGGRERGYGGGLGPTPGSYAINLDNIYEPVGYIEDAWDINFRINDSYKFFFLMGLTGYGAVGNGIRIGGSFQSGSITYSVRKDTNIYTLEVTTTFGGLLLEKAILTGSMNWLVGGMAGGAKIELNPYISRNYVPSLTDEYDTEEYSKITASSLLLELHGGFTYTMVRWFHIGLDFSTPLFFSPSGFKSSNGQSFSKSGFTTINPGLRIRIILGNIG
jgi:hypothetical protein